MIFKNMVQYLLKKFTILEYGLVCALTSNNFVVKLVLCLELHIHDTITFPINIAILIFSTPPCLLADRISCVFPGGVFTLFSFEVSPPIFYR